MPLLPGAEPCYRDGGPVGALLCHGFTGSPQALRQWADYLGDHDITVALPLLPGHGTHWQDMALTRAEDWYAELDRAFDLLRTRCDAVFVMGLSMGGTLALRLAQRHGSAVTGLVLVNPSLLDGRPLLRLLPVLQHIVPSAPGIASDIKKPGAREVAYDRVPLGSLRSLTRLWEQTRRDLPRVTQPVLVFRSTEDHVVGPESVRLLLARIASPDVEHRLCPDSYHVATLDHDAERIFTGSLDFVHRLAPTVTGS
ncbi:MAG: alpha/beta hydrolase [Carbonactinosporaceae bacterium]